MGWPIPFGVESEGAAILHRPADGNDERAMMRSGGWENAHVTGNKVMRCIRWLLATNPVEFRDHVASYPRR